MDSKRKNQQVKASYPGVELDCEGHELTFHNVDDTRPNDEGGENEKAKEGEGDENDSAKEGDERNDGDGEHAEYVTPVPLTKHIQRSRKNKGHHVRVINGVSEGGTIPKGTEE